jgi:hypothetical protein
MVATTWSWSVKISSRPPSNRLCHQKLAALGGYALSSDSEARAGGLEAAQYDPAGAHRPAHQCRVFRRRYFPATLPHATRDPIAAGNGESGHLLEIQLQRLGHPAGQPREALVVGDVDEVEDRDGRPGRRCWCRRGDHDGRGGDRRRRRRGLQRSGEVLRASESFLPFLGERPDHHGLDLAGNIAPQRSQGRGRGHEVVGDHGHRVGAGEWGPPRQQLVQHASEAVDVAPAVNIPPAYGLLRAHVTDRADGHAGLCERGVGLVAREALGRARNAEVRDQGVAVGEHDVLGFDVAVNDAPAVGVPERLGHLAHQAHAFPHRERATPPEAVAQALAFHVGHREPEEPAGVARIVDRQDVRVLEPGGEANLALEALRPQRVGQPGMEHLQGDGSVVLEIAGEMDRGHAAAPELTLERIATAQGLRERGQGVGDGGGSNEERDARICGERRACASVPLPRHRLWVLDGVGRDAPPGAPTPQSVSGWLPADPRHD